MAVVMEDDIGLYIRIKGCLASPDGYTMFDEGDSVKCGRMGGSIFAGVGKDANCRRGQYLEIWKIRDSYL